MKTDPTPKKGGGGRILFRVLMMLLISLFLGGAVYSVNARRILGDAMPMPFGYGLSVVLSGSMEPTLSVNDLVVVQAADSYEVDDIVVYQSGRSLIIHRIVDIEGEVFTAKGDANDTADEPIPLTAVKGKAVHVIPWLGLPVRLLQTTAGKIVIILLAAFLLSRSWRKERSEDEEELDQIKDEIRRLKALEEAALSDREAAPSPEQKPDQPASGENPL